MKVEFLGLQDGGKRQSHRDFAIEIIAETDFEQSFFQALFDSTGGKSMQPKGSLLCNSLRGCSIMIEAEDFSESQLAKERQQRIDEKAEEKKNG